MIARGAAEKARKGPNSPDLSGGPHRPAANVSRTQQVSAAMR